MRNVLPICVLASLLVVTTLGAPADAQGPDCCEATVDVVLTIMPYCCIEMPSDVEVIVDEESCQGPGPFIGIGCVEICACANFWAIMSAYLDVDPGAPGTWQADITGLGAPGPFIGEECYVLQITVTGIMCDDYAREMEWVGTVTVTVCPSPV